MKTKQSAVNNMLILSISFTTILIIFRIIFSQELTYIFLAWNIFLAIIPLWFSRKLLQQKEFRTKSVLLLFLWLIFYPNAPYIITDLFHYTDRPPIPFWFDLLIMISAVWNGLILGLISLLQVEQFLSLHIQPYKVKALVILSFFLCGYGIYIGRFLRYNTWDVIAQPKGLLIDTIQNSIHPFHHPRTWAFTVLFAVMMAVIYYTLKSLIDLFRVNVYKIKAIAD